MKGLEILLITILVQFATADVKTGDSAEANRAVYQVVYQPESQYGTYGYENTYREPDDTYQRYDDSYRGHHDAETHAAYAFPAYPVASEKPGSLFLSGGIFRPYGYDDDAYAYDTGSKPYAYDMRYYGDKDGRYAKYPYYSRRQY